ncbi:MAG: FAD-dependent oxidoreductase [Candidatus Methanofastidiosia archaeon]|jgi:dihydrolipoamide dehydrogenase
MITIVGGGPGGYTAAIRCSQLGLPVTVIEKEEIGGTCLNWGCIPGKVFLKGSKLYSELETGEPYGITVKRSPFDMRRLIEKKEETRQSLVTGLKNVMRSYDIRIVHGTGKIIDGNTVSVEQEEISSEKVIMATGSVPDVPHLFQELAITYKEVFELEYVPRSVLVVYGGVFSVELAWFFSEMGSQVYMLHNRLLEKEFADIENRISWYLKNKGVEFIEGRISSIKKRAHKKLVEIKEKEIMVEEVIWMKRKLCTEGLEHVKSLIKNGKIPVNRSMETDIPDLYAVGDITGSYLAGDAMAQAVVAAENAAGNNAVYNTQYIPKVLYAPEAAVVGLTEEEAAQKYDVVKGSFPFGASGRAQTLGAAQGRVTVLSDKKYGEILGGYIIGKNATELIHVVSFAMKLEATIDELSQLACAHPTMVEMIRDAGLDIHGTSFNLPKK